MRCSRILARNLGVAMECVGRMAGSAGADAGVELGSLLGWYILYCNLYCIGLCQSPEVRIGFNS